MIILTERDRSTIQFIGKWRFATLEQLQKAGIFLTSRKRAYHRLYELCQGEYLKARIQDKGQLYYYLTPKGGEAAGLLDLYWSSRYRDARRDLILKTLTACDFSLAAGVEYISQKDALDRLKSAPYDILKSCFEGAATVLCTGKHAARSYHRLQPVSEVPGAENQNILPAAARTA